MYPAVAACFVSILCSSAPRVFAQGTTASLSDPLPELRPACDPPKYATVPQPDYLAETLSKQNHYRLVIGASEFQDSPDINNRAYVEATAKLIDKKLESLHYDPLPGIGGAPYLVGQAATKDAIVFALKLMAAATNKGDYGIVYWVGHGSIAPSHVDLTLSVYDRPVTEDEGVRVSDLLAYLTIDSVYQSDVTQIPHLLVILDTCFSGTVAQGANQTIVETGGVQRLAVVSAPGPLVPDQIGILTATASGGGSEAYELKGTGLSAFGYYFSRAIDDDWACSDSIARDGILTLRELSAYLKDRLQLANKSHALEKPMVPSLLARDYDKFIAYRADRYVEPGLRKEILEVLVQPKADQVISVALPSGNTVVCNQSAGCRFPISRAFINSDLVVTAATKGSGTDITRSSSSDIGGGIIATGVGLILNLPEPSQIVPLKSLLNSSAKVSGATLSIK